jgi:hypothetical protein
MGQLGLLEADNNQAIELLMFPDDRPSEGHLTSSLPAKAAMKDPSIESTAQQTQGEGGEGSGANNLGIEGAECRMRPSHPAQKEDGGAASTVSAIDNAKNGGTNNPANESSKKRLRLSSSAEKEKVRKSAGFVSGIEISNNEGGSIPTQAHVAFITGNENESPEIELPAP